MIKFASDRNSKMTLGIDQKEDLRLRMMELEKKLAESEEERSKLEKTCNILMRAFREEEKMRYKALNKKYEKFLEDCTQRRRRNDIILKSLCRIEDRARALFAKTERLKILKDRYISYLKISDIKQQEPVFALKNFPYSSQSQKTTHDVTPKSVHWKSPDISDVMLGRNIKEFIEPDSFSHYGSTGGSLTRENKEDILGEIYTPRRTSEFKKPEKDAVTYQKLWSKAPSEDRKNAFENQQISEGTVENYEPPKTQAKIENASLNRENKCDNVNYIPLVQNTSFKNDLRSPVITDREMSYSKFLSNDLEEKSIDDVVAVREKVASTHQESIEKLKKALSVEEDDEIENDKKFKNTGETQKIIEKDEIEMNEKNNLKPNYEDLNRLAISKTDTGPYNELKSDAFDLRSDHFENVEDIMPENFPVGLDGVDYQNETYPESYYEQPVHHNHTSIASDVILEEDESEQDVDQNISEKEAKKSSFRSLESENESYLSKNNIQETGQPNDPYPERQLIDSQEKENNLYDELQKFNGHENQSKMDSTGFDRDDQSRKSDSTVKSEKSNKRAPQSNLLHLLESDSESFQIEHGDLATGNEDSDFDFSFNQN